MGYDYKSDFSSKSPLFDAHDDNQVGVLRVGVDVNVSSCLEGNSISP